MKFSVLILSQMKNRRDSLFAPFTSNKTRTSKAKSAFHRCGAHRKSYECSSIHWQMSGVAEAMACPSLLGRTGAVWSET